MTKFIKVCLIAGSICVLAGGTISVVASFFGGNLWKIIPEKSYFLNKIASDVDFNDLFQDNDFEEEDYQQYQNLEQEGNKIFSVEDIQEMDITVREGKIVLLDDSPDNKITVSCNDNHSEWSSEVSNEKLKITLDADAIVTLRVPKDFHVSKATFGVKKSHSFFDGNTGSSQSPSIMVQSVNADELNLLTKSGSVVIENGNVGKLDIDSDVGSTEYSGYVSGDIDTDCNVGAVSLTLNNKKKEYNYNIKCRLGAIKLGDEEFAGLASKRTIDNGSDKTIDLNCKTGAIEIDFVEDSF